MQSPETVIHQIQYRASKPCKFLQHTLLALKLVLRETSWRAPTW
jgi:hypothetical protein